MTPVRSTVINVNSLEEHLSECSCERNTHPRPGNNGWWFPQIYKILRLNLFILTALCWSYFHIHLDFAGGDQLSGSFSLQHKSQIFQALWYKEAYCFKPLSTHTHTHKVIYFYIFGYKTDFWN